MKHCKALHVSYKHTVSLLSLVSVLLSGCMRSAVQFDSCGVRLPEACCFEAFVPAGNSLLLADRTALLQLHVSVSQTCSS